MIVLKLIFALLGVAAGIAAYRLGMADGLSAARRGRLAGGKEPRQRDLLQMIDAYQGRKEPYEERK